MDHFSGIPDAQLGEVKDGAMRFAKKLALGGLVFYFFFGTLTYFAGSHAKDFPPFFHWYLFNQIPSEYSQIQYTIQVVSADGVEFDEPVPFNRAQGIVIDARSNRARDLFTRIGHAIENGDTDEAIRLRQLIENGYLRVGTVYEVVAVTYAPIRRFQTDAFEDVRVLATYAK